MVLSKEYLAGLFDGEGHVSITYSYKNGGNHPKLCLKITNTHLPVLLLIKEIYGGNIYANKHKQESWLQCYVLSLTVVQSKQFIYDVFPYLVIKQKQAIVALEFSDTVYRRGKKIVTDEEYEIRSRCMESVKKLKQEQWKTPYSEDTLSKFLVEYENNKGFIQHRKTIDGENHIGWE